MTDINSQKAQGSGAAIALIADLTAIVRLQNGNRHDDVNALLARADKFLSQPPEASEGVLRSVLEEARLQLVYMDERSPSGTTPAVIAHIDAALAQPAPEQGEGN